MSNTGPKEGDSKKPQLMCLDLFEENRATGKKKLKPLGHARGWIFEEKKPMAFNEVFGGLPEH